MKINKILGSIFIVALILSGCTKKDQKEINIIGENSSNIKALIQTKDDIQKKLGIKLNFVPLSFNDAFEKANQDLINKTGQYDIILQYNFSLASFVRNNWVFLNDELKKNNPDLNYSFENQLFTSAWKEVSEYYAQNNRDSFVKAGYPFASNTMLLVYRKDLFEDVLNKSEFRNNYGADLKPPTTWSELYNTAKYFSKKNDIKGICLEGAEGGWLYYEFCCFLYMNGAKIMDKERGWQIVDNSKLMINTKEFSEALRKYLSLKEFNVGDYNTVDAGQQRRIMKDGKAAMAIMWSDYIYDLIFSTDGKIDDRFGFIPIPGGKSPIAGGSFYINRNTQKADIAFKYVVEIMQKETQEKLLKLGLCSSNKAAYTQEVFNKIPYSKALYNSLENGVYMFEAGPDADLISNTITKYIQQAWHNQLNVDETKRELDRDIKKEREGILKLIKW